MRIVDSNPPATDADFAAVEAATGVQLPKAYAEFLRWRNGGRPEPNVVTVTDSSGGKRRTDVAWFFNIGDDPDENLIAYHGDYLGRLPPDTLAVARTSGGSLFLIGTGGERLGKIYFWDEYGEEDDGETPSWNNVYPAADDLRAFLLALETL